MAEETGIARESLAEIDEFARGLRRKLPRYMVRALGKGMYLEGRRFKREFRAGLGSKFKSGGKTVGNAFKVYTDGRDLNTLRLGVFTRWPAAEIYEEGGTIRPAGKWLAFPVNPRAYTAKGRIKRSWRDGSNPSKLNQKKFDDTRPIRLRGGAILLVRDRGVSKSGRVGRVTKKRGVEASEPMFMMIKRTRREPVLEFFSGFARMAGSRNQKLQDAVHDALRAFARDS